MTNISATDPRGTHEDWRPVSSGNRSDFFPDNVIAQWLTSAYGKTEAARIVALSVELRDELYFDLVTKGPAGDEIVKVVEVIKVCLLQPNGVWVDKQLRFIGRSIGYSEARTRIYRQNEFALLHVHGQILNMAAFLERPAGSRSDARNGLIALMWALNAQHPYFEQFAVLDQDFILATNALLAVLGFESLRGSFLDLPA